MEYKELWEAIALIGGIFFGAVLGLPPFLCVVLGAILAKMVQTGVIH